MKLPTPIVPDKNLRLITVLCLLSHAETADKPSQVKK